MAFLFDKIRNYTVVEDFEHLNCFVRNLENIYCVFRCRSIDNEYTGGQTLVMDLNRLGICQVVAVDPLLKNLYLLRKSLWLTQQCQNFQLIGKMFMRIGLEMV